MTEPRGFMDEDNSKPLLASELALVLTRAVEVYGDKPVQMAAWFSENPDENDAAVYVYPYGHGGTGFGEEGPDYFYIHGTPIQEPSHE